MCLAKYISIPSRGFWFFEGRPGSGSGEREEPRGFQSPRGDFGFLKGITLKLGPLGFRISIPSRGFWFFEAPDTEASKNHVGRANFNPLAGILVF